MALSSYSYLVYPLLLVLFSRKEPQISGSEKKVTRLSVIVAARNEGAKIAAKLENTLSLNAAGVDLEVIVASDASDDCTDEITSKYSTRGVILVRSPVRLGKEHAQKLAITRSTGEVLVFTDAGTFIPEGALTAIVERFSNPRIGAVSSVDRIVMADGSVQGEGLYVKYEMWLRKLEARFHSLVGLSGSFFAARKEVCLDWDTRIPSDFGTALNCIRYGYRAVSDPEVVGVYRNVSDPSKEYGRKLRTVLRGMVGLRCRSDVLNPLKYGRFSLQVFSHKVMRWAVPWLLMLAFIVNAGLLTGSVLYKCTFIAMSMLFLSPVLLRIFPAARKLPLMRVAAYFVEANVAILHASIRMGRGETMMTWEPSKRQP